MRKDFTLADLDRLKALLASPDDPGCERKHGAMQATKGREVRRRDVLPRYVTAFFQYRHLRMDPAPHLGKARVGVKFSIVKGKRA